MMKKIANPYRKIENYSCFGCSPTNPIGLRLNFIEKDDEIICEWEPGNLYEGWINILHGGIQATLIDEIASWAVFVKIGLAGVTRDISVKYRKPVYVSDGKVTCKAKVLDIKRNLANIAVELYSKDVLCAEGKVVYFLFSLDESQEKFKFPGVEAFYEK